MITCCQPLPLEHSFCYDLAVFFPLPPCLQHTIARKSFITATFDVSVVHSLLGLRAQMQFPWPTVGTQVNNCSGVLLLLGSAFVLCFRAVICSRPRLPRYCSSIHGCTTATAQMLLALNEVSEVVPACSCVTGVLWPNTMVFGCVCSTAATVHHCKH